MSYKRNEGALKRVKTEPIWGKFLKYNANRIQYVHRMQKESFKTKKNKKNCGLRN
jgi:hypothetical protein